MTLMDLAERFGRADVDAFLASLGSRQITEWLMYYKIEREDAESRRNCEKLRQSVRNRGARRLHG